MSVCRITRNDNLTPFPISACIRDACNSTLRPPVGINLSSCQFKVRTGERWSNSYHLVAHSSGPSVAILLHTLVANKYFLITARFRMIAGASASRHQQMFHDIAVHHFLLLVPSSQWDCFCWCCHLKTKNQRLISPPTSSCQLYNTICKTNVAVEKTSTWNTLFILFRVVYDKNHRFRTKFLQLLLHKFL